MPSLRFKTHTVRWSLTQTFSRLETSSSKQRKALHVTHETLLVVKEVPLNWSRISCTLSKACPPNHLLFWWTLLESSHWTCTRLRWLTVPTNFIWGQILDVTQGIIEASMTIHQVLVAILLHTHEHRNAYKPFQREGISVPSRDKCCRRFLCMGLLWMVGPQ